MGKESVLVWGGKSDTLYRAARRQIMIRNSIAPKTVKELDFSDFFTKNPVKLAYFPVFQNTTGWWGELLGTNAKIQSKIIVSAECQLYEIGRGAPMTTHQLHAAEILPKSGLIQKIRNMAITIKDMIATDSGTVLALLSGGSEDKVRNCVKLNGGEYFGTLGGY
jgi:hypothetical protein